jgi:hypothetical protein
MLQSPRWLECSRCRWWSWAQAGDVEKGPRAEGAEPKQMLERLLEQSPSRCWRDCWSRAQADVGEMDGAEPIQMEKREPEKWTRERFGGG